MLNNPLKMVVAAVALIAPIAVGWTYTSGAFSDYNADHDVHEFDLDGYIIIREEIDGVMTEVITDPEGNVIGFEDLPAHLAAELEDWTRPEPTHEFAMRDGTPCYIELRTPDPDGDFGIVESADDGTFVVRITVDDDGDIMQQAVHTAQQIGEETIRAYEQGDLPLTDLPGAVEIAECQ